MPFLKIESDQIIKEIKKRKAKKVLIQAPAGIKRKIAVLSPEIEKKTNAKIFLSADTCYGACDIPLGIINAIKPELVLHLGHAKMVEQKSMAYIPLEYNFSEKETQKLSELLLIELEKKGIKKASGTATAQYLELLYKISETLEKKGIKIDLKKGKSGLKGHILGCESSAAGKENVVFIGDGLFHVKGIDCRQVLALRPFSKKAEWIKNEKRKMQGDLLKAMQCKRFGIVLSAKPGQLNERLALKIKKALEKKGKIAVLIACDNVLEQHLEDFNLECFIAVACPRIADDAKNWKKPLITAEKALMLFK